MDFVGKFAFGFLISSAVCFFPTLNVPKSINIPYFWIGPFFQSRRYVISWNSLVCKFSTTLICFENFCARKILKSCGVRVSCNKKKYHFTLPYIPNHILPKKKLLIYRSVFFKGFVLNLNHLTTMAPTHRVHGQYCGCCAALLSRVLIHRYIFSFRRHAMSMFTLKFW